MLDEAIDRHTRRFGMRLKKAPRPCACRSALALCNATKLKERELGCVQRKRVEHRKRTRILLRKERPMRACKSS